MWKRWQRQYAVWKFRFRRPYVYTWIICLCIIFFQLSFCVTSNARQHNPRCNVYCIVPNATRFAMCCVTINQNQMRETSRQTHAHMKQTADKQKQFCYTFALLIHVCNRCCTIMLTLCILMASKNVCQNQRYIRHCQRCWKCATFHCKWPATQRETHKWWERKKNRWRVTFVASQRV